MTTLRLTEKATGERFDVTIGTEIELLLPENPTTGFRWELEAPIAPDLAVEAAEFKTASANAGSDGTRLFRFVVQREGMISLRAKLRRQWEGDRSIIARFAVTLAVSGRDKKSSSEP